MPKKLHKIQRKITKMQRGQVLVLVAFSAILIIAIIGLSIDVGLLFIGNARLRRAVDAAALSAALQYRQGFGIDDLTRAANEFLVLNGFTNPQSTVYDCDNAPVDLLAELCTDPPRKLVRVYATADINMAFLSVIGINRARISATAESETASLDVVLVIDTSESMTYGADPAHVVPPSDPMRDPSFCNDPDKYLDPDFSGHLSAQPSTTTSTGVYVQTSACEPFEKVVSAAIQFSDILFSPYDHAAIITFANEPNNDLTLLNGDNLDLVRTTLAGLTVYEGDGVFKTNGSTASPLRCYGPVSACTPDICSETPIWNDSGWDGSSSNYKALLGKGQDPCLPGYVNPPDPSHYTTTNIGGGLQMAGNEFATDSRQESLWVVILLTDGVANAGHSSAALGPIYYCPDDTWSNLPRCNDLDVAADQNPASRPAPDSGNYDASDYAYDMADFIGMPYPKGQDALLYTIGLGPEVTNYGDLGTTFLNYAANVGRGQAYFTTHASDLARIFRSIGTNIATRISR